MAPENFPGCAGIPHEHDHLPEERDRVSRGAVHFPDVRVMIVGTEDGRERDDGLVGLDVDHGHQEEA